MKVGICSVIIGFIAAILALPARAEGLTFTEGGLSATVYGLLDFGAVSRSDSNGLVPPSPSHNDFESGAGSGGSRIGVKIAYPLGGGFTAIGETEWGYNLDGDSQVDGSGAAGTGGFANFINRHSWVGVTSAWGTLIGGKLDGGRASVLKEYDPFLGASVASAGSIQIVTTRADDAVAYVSPNWHGVSAILAYTANLFGVGAYDAQSPVYAFIPSYKSGPVSITYDHEEEWFHPAAGLGRLRLNLFAGSYDFNVVKIIGFYEKTTVAQPIGAIGFYADHKGYLLGATAPVSAKGLVKVSWTRRDSSYIDNVCDKVGIGYQYNFTKKAYLYTDFARINNDRKGTCTIAYTNEQTSNDLGHGDAGGYGIQGLDIGFVLSF